ncbi:hypothetical protein F444_22993 [Phytophthora nicotianae P1976]|uniref:Uncharacterized protein n=1 Tax=Phytophthora nicotianae P1976 TaxID=1317066 RepID=A0A080YW64_PHYNI|nr:hypothetical protein F444_22993 [Phytophthora nicotianae P1976]
MDYYPHFSRKAQSKATLLQNEKFIKNNMLPNIKHLYEAQRSEDQFEALSELFLQYLSSDDYSNLLQEYYVTDGWANWYGTCAVPGIAPSQNALELHH